MFYLSNVAIAVNISQPSVRIGGCLHALIHIFFLHGGSKSAKPHWDLKYNSFEKKELHRSLHILAEQRSAESLNIQYFGQSLERCRATPVAINRT